jgi:SAM-dependent methyltransferase
MPAPSDKAALRGEPSYVWRAGQERRLSLVRAAAPGLAGARVLDDGCGLGVYVARLRAFTPHVFGLEYELERAILAGRRLGAGGCAGPVVCAAGECLPYPDETFDYLLSNEVIEHVQDDRAALAEMARVLRSPDPAAGRPGGRALIFCPNRWYPVETHGIYWRGRYIFGNIPLVNYLPDALRHRLAPHVRAYTGRGLRRRLQGLPLRVVSHSRIFGGYDNLIARFGPAGRALRAVLQALERTPFNRLGLSHFLVVEKVRITAPPTPAPAG